MCCEATYLGIYGAFGADSWPKMASTYQQQYLAMMRCTLDKYAVKSHIQRQTGLLALTVGPKPSAFTNCKLRDVGIQARML